MPIKGTVKWFNAKKGYGFIANKDGKDIYVHQSALQHSDFGSLKQGQEVQFEIVSGPKGNQATNVMIIDGPKQSIENQIRAFRKESKEILRDLKKRSDRR